MIRIFPIASSTTRVSNDFGYVRYEGARPHEGNDLFDPVGTPLVAVDDGELRSGLDPTGGLIVNLYSSDGSRYYYAHLSRFVNGSTSPPLPRQVRAGDLVGYLGATGNAAGTPPHLHFEVHPRRGEAVNPNPALLAATRVRAPGELGANRDRRTSPLALALFIGAAGLGAWALTNPKEARRLARKVIPAW